MFRKYTPLTTASFPRLFAQVVTAGCVVTAASVSIGTYLTNNADKSLQNKTTTEVPTFEGRIVPK